MRQTRYVLLVLAVALLALGGCTPAGQTGSEKRQTLRDLRDDTLARLYAQRPESRGEVAQSVGTGVFSTAGAQLGLGGAYGYGIATETATGNETFMRMAEIQAGLGVGAKGADYVFIFRKPSTFRNFVAGGWEFGAEAEAGAASQGQGGTASTKVSTDADPVVYLVSATGVTLAANLTGTKFSLYKELN